MTMQVIVPNQLIIHYDIDACNHVCPLPPLAHAVTAVAEHQPSTSRLQVAVLHVLAVCNDPNDKHCTN